MAISYLGPVGDSFWKGHWYPYFEDRMTLPLGCTFGLSVVLHMFNILAIWQMKKNIFGDPLMRHALY